LSRTLRSGARIGLAEVTRIQANDFDGSDDLGSVTLVPERDHFGQAGTCGATLSPIAMCTIIVVFSLKAIVSLAGSITFTDNAPGKTQNVALTGSLKTMTATALQF
jgi:hypothetical protein